MAANRCGRPHSEQLHFKPNATDRATRVEPGSRARARHMHTCTRTRTHSEACARNGTTFRFALAELGRLGTDGEYGGREGGGRLQVALDAYQISS